MINGYAQNRRQPSLELFNQITEKLNSRKEIK